MFYWTTNYPFFDLQCICPISSIVYNPLVAIIGTNHAAKNLGQLFK